VTFSAMHVVAILEIIFSAELCSDCDENASVFIVYIKNLNAGKVRMKEFFLSDDNRLWSKLVNHNKFKVHFHEVLVICFLM
jgi:hypothetical protein